MARVYLGIGSNIDRYRHIGAALDALSAEFAPLRLSRVYESEAVGFAGDNFLNLVAGFDCGLPLAQLADRLRQLEYDHGRARNAPKFGPRTLDIDILTYDDLVGEHAGVRLPRGEITENAFVLLPLSEVAGDEVHPVTGKTYRELWRDYDPGGQRLWAVAFDWAGG